MSIVSNNLKRVKPSPTIAVTTKAREMRAAGKDVIGLGAGSLILILLTILKKQLLRRLEKVIQNILQLMALQTLKAIQAKFIRENNLSYELDQISVRTGGKQVLYNTFMATLNKGDEKSCLHLIGCRILI